MLLCYTAPQDPQLDLQLETFLRFWRKRADELVMVRVLANPIGKGDADVACATNGADLVRLIRTAARDRYCAPDGSPRIYQGTYARLCHTTAPRDWLDRGRPTLTAATAASYPGFVIDVDAIKAGASSNEAELQETLRTADEILGWMDSVIDLDRSYCLPVMSGNGTQLNIRCALDVHEAGLARTLLLRMKGRWPTVDESGWMMSIGPAVPGTRKCKGMATEDRPHRMVQILGTREGERRLSGEDLRKLISALPEVTNDAMVTREWRRAYDAFSAVAELSIEDVCEQLFGQRSICPVCRSTDGSVAVIASNLVTCQHRHRCPAASAGKTGFTPVHAYGVMLDYGWGPYSPEQRVEIVEAAQMDGWELTWDDGEEPEWPDERAVALKPRVEALLASLVEPNRHCTVLPGEPWRLTVKGPARVADHVARAIKRSFCPDWADDRTLVLCGRLYVYHQGLGIWVTVSPTPDIDRVHRIIDDQVKGAGIWIPEKGGMKAWEPPTKPVIESLEHTLPQPHFFREGKVGLECRDGFLELVGTRWEPRPHHPDNRARGRVSKSCASVLRDIDQGSAGAAVKALREILVKTMQRDDKTVDGLALIFLEQMGAVICRVRPELRSALFLHGADDTGKSSLLRIAAAMAQRVGLTVTGSSLADLNGTFPDESLIGSDINIVMEEGAFDGGRGVKTSRLKQIVEGSSWSFARKNRPNVQIAFDLLWLSASNSEPSFAENSGAIAKRAYIVQYPARRAETLDYGMVPRFLDQHLDGVIAASLAGAARLSATGRTVLPDNHEIVKHTRELGRTVSLVEAWLESGVQLSVSNEADALFDDAHGACVAWGQRHGMRAESESLRVDRFTRELNKLSVRKVRWSHGTKYAPVVLRVAADPDEDTSRL